MRAAVTKFARMLHRENDFVDISKLFPFRRMPQFESTNARFNQRINIVSFEKKTVNDIQRSQSDVQFVTFVHDDSGRIIRVLSCLDKEFSFFSAS